MYSSYSSGFIVFGVTVSGRLIFLSFVPMVVALGSVWGVTFPKGW